MLLNRKLPETNMWIEELSEQTKENWIKSECRKSLRKKSNSGESNHWRTEWMNRCTQNETIYNRCTQNETIYNSQRLSYKWSLGGTRWNKLDEVQGETTGIKSTQIRWFSDSQAGRLDPVSGGQRQLKGAIRFESTDIKWFSWWACREIGLDDWRPETLKTKPSSGGITRLEPTQIR
jgi:hypothetical protein